MQIAMVTIKTTSPASEPPTIAINSSRFTILDQLKIETTTYRERHIINGEKPNDSVTNLKKKNI